MVANVLAGFGSHRSALDLAPFNIHCRSLHDLVVQAWSHVVQQVGLKRHVAAMVRQRGEVADRDELPALQRVCLDDLTLRLLRAPIVAISYGQDAYTPIV